MRVARRIRGALGAAITVCGLGSAIGLPNAQAEPSPPPVPSLIDHLVTSTPVLWTDPRYTGGFRGTSDEVGMVCSNLRMRCR